MLARLLYAPFLAQVIVTRRCNLSCGYCDEYDDVSAPVPRADLERRIDQVKALGTLAIELMGGEPLMHPELPAIVAHARKRRFRRVMLVSNGFLLTEERVLALNEAGLDRMQVSVDGVHPNEVTSKTLKSVRGKLELLARLAKFRVTLSAVVGSAPPDEVREVLAFAHAQGFRPRVILMHQPGGRLQAAPEQLAVYDSLDGSIGRPFREAGDYRRRLMKDGRAPFKCRGGSRFIYVDEHGVVRWCPTQRNAFGIPLSEYTTKDLARQFHTRKPCSDGCTVGCVRTCSGWDEMRRQDLDPPPSLIPLRRSAPPVSQ